MKTQRKALSLRDIHPQKREALKARMYSELEALTSEPLKANKEFENNPLEYYYNWLAEKHKKTNSLNLKPTKLIDLLEISISDFEKAIAKFKSVPNIEKPTKEAFKVYAETPEELARLKLANDLIAIAERADKVVSTYGGVNLSEFKPIVSISGNKYVPNVFWIKSTHQQYKNIL